MLKKKRRSSAPRVKVQDAFSNPLARLGFETPNIMEGTQYTLQRLTRDFNMLNALYRENWIIRRIIDTIPSDMLKNGFTITTELGPEPLKRFDRELRTTQLIEKLRKGLKWGRLYGGALGVMLIQGQGDDLSEPLDLELIMPGDFVGLMILDRWNGVSPSSELVDDIADPEYGLPKYYNVTDPVDGTMVSVHHSRCVRFVGNDLPYWEELSEVMWGASVVESVFDELKKRDNVSWNIAQLTFMANMRILKMNDLGQLLASTDSTSQQELYRTIQAQNVLMNNMGLMVMDAADSIESHQYTFGGLAECYQQFIMDIAGAAEIPVTRLFGRSPAGLNATGESDLQNYYEMIAEKQETYLRPIFSKLLPVICMSVFGAVPDDLDFEFDPVAEPSDEQRADLAKTGTDIVVSAVGAGLVSPRTGLKELKQQSERTNVWTNITDEDIEKASDEIDQGEMDMGGFPGMGGVEHTDGPQGPEEGEEVETTAPPTKDARGLKHAAIDNCIDVNGDEHDELGLFTGSNSIRSKMPLTTSGKKPKGIGGGSGQNYQKPQKIDLQNASKPANVVINETEKVKATPKEKAFYRKALVGTKTSCGVIIKDVGDHACDRIKEREKPPDVVAAVLRKANPTKDPTHPGRYRYESDGVRVVISRDGVVVSVVKSSKIPWKRGKKK